MAVCDLLDLPAGARGAAPLVGLDIGEKTIGVALSDLSWTIASPAGLIRRRKFTADAADLLALCDSRAVCALVIGLPVNMNGEEGPRCQSVRAFARRLLHLRDLPIAFWDERLSTRAADRVLVREADVSRRRRAELVDKLAAAWILQGALDRLRTARPDPTSAA